MKVSFETTKEDAGYTTFHIEYTSPLGQELKTKLYSPILARHYLTYLAYHHPEPESPNEQLNRLIGDV